MGWFRKINKNGEDYKPIGNVITATSLSVSGPNLADGDVVRVMFTTDIAGSDTSTPLALTWNGSATPIPVKAMKSGSLVGMYAFEYAANLYRYISAYATLELAYDETNAQFVVVGNPVVLSGSNYTIYADGWNGDGNPVGTIIAQYKNSNPVGYLPLDGTTFDQTKYPALYAYLGNSNTLPDYREFALVGAGQNTTSAEISSDSHDVYTTGEAKNDCFQNHIHSYLDCISLVDPSLGYHMNQILKVAYGDDLVVSGSGSVTQVKYRVSVTESHPLYGTARLASVTRGKRKAVYFYIKAM